MLELLVRPLADAFMQVGVFVALMVAPFGWARHRWRDGFDRVLVRYRGLGPLLAAALTMPPGCGGAIIVVTLYARGAVSYGAAVAALVATMGDVSWVLLAAEPVLTLQLKALLLVVGTLTGYAVDGMGIDPTRRGLPDLGDGDARRAPSSPVSTRASTTTPGGAVGGGVALAEAPVQVRARLDPGIAALCALVALGATVSLPVTFQLWDPVVLYLVLGTLGTVAAGMVLVRKRLRQDEVAGHGASDTHQVLLDTAHETAFVTGCVAAAFVGWSLLENVLGLDVTDLPLLGLTGVVVGALVGLVPGCGLQIVFAGVFLAGGMPTSTLVAGTLSQDGDALLPLLALAPRSAALAAALTTVPALMVGSVLVLFG